jgi:hypothetical protein
VYEPFNLPMCSRCTRVIVEAVNDIVKAAISNGRLKGRITKPYKYFDNRAKDEMSDRFSTVTYKKLFAKQFGWYIETKLNEIAKEIRENVSVLVISPDGYVLDSGDHNL